MNASSPPAVTVDEREAAHFGALAADWWDPNGSSAMLHRLNPARLRYIRERVDEQRGTDHKAFRPLEGQRALDVGCGAGLVSEPLARLGAAVTGIDAAGENIAAAREHADGQELAIDYRVGGIEALAQDECFDLITALEVIEHVAEPRAFVAALARALTTEGVFILSTPNRTALSRLALITFAEGVGSIPRGTHDWSRFLKPEELIAMLKAEGLRVIDRRGLVPSLSGFRVSSSEALDYFITAVRA